MDTKKDLLGGDWNHGISMTFHSVGNVKIPSDELHHFSEGWLNHQQVICLVFFS